jgi:hypothetical protein
LRRSGITAVLILLGALFSPVRAGSWMDSSMGLLQGELTARYGPGQRPRIQRGLAQVARFWQPGDGGAGEFEAFVRAQFAGQPAALDGLFRRMETVVESLEGHLLEIRRDFRSGSELDLGPPLPIDAILDGYDPGAHVNEDCFADKLAFAVLLNFPLTTLEERVRNGASWTDRQWAEARLAERFCRRVPAEVNQAVAEASAAADRYIAGYDIRMHHLVDVKGRRPFPPGMRLACHWNLRDEIKAQYAEGKAGLPRQRVIQKVMERIVTQTIPAVVVDNPDVDWNPTNNAVTWATAAGRGAAPSAAPEPDTRYQVLLQTFQAARKLDPYAPLAPTQIARSFDQDRQLPEARVEAMLGAVCGSPLVARTARLIRARLGRKLEPFDIWYNGFSPAAGHREADLDAIVRKRYPDVEAYRKDMPNLLRTLGFSPGKAAWLADNIEVDPARGSGQALGAARRADHPHLRTRIGPNGMDYKGFNIAVHQNGHAVEQSFSLNEVEHPLMSGVPGTAFTEALAFLFQARDLELLGLPRPDAPDAHRRALAALGAFWSTYEIAGAAMVDTALWHWLYEHPAAGAGELKAAVEAIARDVWNRFYAPVLGQKDCVLLAIYSHMVANGIDLPDYPVGRMIAAQLEGRIARTGNLGETFEQCARLGRLTPDLWMERAAGSPVGPEALLEAAAAALKELGG